jgi:threonine dehydratase
MWKCIGGDTQVPELGYIESTLIENRRLLVETPVWEWKGVEKDKLVGVDRKVFCKLELLQHTGSFKPRGAFCVMKSMTQDQLFRGVTCVSAGNHALAVAYAAKELGTTAHVVMPKTASNIRLTRCKELGAQISLEEDITKAFAKVKQIEQEEGRLFVHPFEGPLTALGTATLGMEFLNQVPQLTSVVIPVGGGGLCAGVSLAVKQINSDCRIIAVEPSGANSMQRSLMSGKPETLDRVATIADSLGSPYAMEYSFRVCEHFIDEIITISDESIRRGMGVLFNCVKIAAEPAGATSTAALVEYLSLEQTGPNVGLLVCGSNIDIKRFYELADDSLFLGI